MTAEPHASRPLGVGTSDAAEIYALVRARWPNLELSAERFFRMARTHLETDPDRSAAQIHWSDLFLASACAEGLSGALTAFESQFGPEIDRLIHASRLAPFPADDFKQRLKQALFTRDGAREPKISSYAGRSQLLHWLRVVVSRAVVDVIREQQSQVREVPLEEALIAMIQPAEPSPEVAHLRSDLQGPLREALHSAIDELSARERNILRQHALHAATLEEIAGVYGVHRATIARWIAAARRSLMSSTRRLLSGRLCLSPEEVDSIIRSVDSQWDLSLERVFR